MTHFQSMLRYQGGRTFDDFLKFLEDQLEADKGFARSPALDELATSWLGAAPGEGQEGLIAKVQSTQPIKPNAVCGEMLADEPLAGVAADNRDSGTARCLTS